MECLEHDVVFAEYEEDVGSGDAGQDHGADADGAGEEYIEGMGATGEPFFLSGEEEGQSGGEAEKENFCGFSFHLTEGKGYGCGDEAKEEGIGIEAVVVEEVGHNSRHEETAEDDAGGEREQEFPVYAVELGEGGFSRLKISGEELE